MKAKVKTILHLLSHPQQLIELMLHSAFPGCLLSDAKAISLLYRRRFGKRINLKSPQTFNEKLLWLTLHDRRPEYSEMVDKYAAKDYIKHKLQSHTELSNRVNGGGKWVVPNVLQVVEHFDEIDFDTLPEKFVIKTTHDSGSVVVCTDKTKINMASSKRMMERSLKNNYFWFSREWAYKNVPPRILVEEYVETERTYPTDFKFYCFNGTPKMCAIIHGREKAHPFMDFVDLHYNRLPIAQRYQNSERLEEQPGAWELMIAIAGILSKDIPFIRVDFFCDKYNNCVIGELTLTPVSGLIPFDNPDVDRKLGDWLDISYL